MKAVAVCMLALAGAAAATAPSKSFLNFGGMKSDAFLDAKAAAENAANAVKAVIKSDDPKAAAIAAVEAKAAAVEGRVKGALDNPTQAVGLLKARIRDAHACVKTPAEYVQAFLARELRCVDSDLYGRIASAPDASTSTKNALNQAQRPSAFFTGADGLAKYLRIGRPGVVGLNMPNNDSFAVQDYASADFKGLQEYKNGQNLISGVGYSAADWSLAEVYTLIVVSRAAVKAQMAVDPVVEAGMNTDVTALAPTWKNLKLLYEYIYAAEGLVIPDAAVAVLESTTFRELSGCPAQCSWHAAALYPSLPRPTTLIIPSNRTSPTECALPPIDYTQPPYNASDLVLVPPTALDATQLAFCNDNWNTAYAAFAAKGYCGFRDGAYRSFCSRNLTRSVEMASYLKELLASTDDAALQATYWRYFLSFGCQGNFNTLFTGNGYTAAGVGGLFAGEATEWSFSPFNGTKLPEGTGVATVQFCLGVNDGEPDPDTGCANLETARP